MRGAVLRNSTQSIKVNRTRERGQKSCGTAPTFIPILGAVSTFSGADRRWINWGSDDSITGLPYKTHGVVRFVSRLARSRSLVHERLQSVRVYGSIEKTAHQQTGMARPVKDHYGSQRSEAAPIANHFVRDLPGPRKFPVQLSSSGIILRP